MTLKCWKCWICREEIVQYLPSNTIEDIESNVEKIVAWVEQCKQR